MSARSDSVICPRCGSRMIYMLEIEGGNSRRLRYYYRCPVCGYKLEDLSLSVRRENSSIVIEAFEAKRRLSYPINILRR